MANVLLQNLQTAETDYVVFKNTFYTAAISLSYLYIVFEPNHFDPLQQLTFKWQWENLTFIMCN